MSGKARNRIDRREGDELVETGVSGRRFVIGAVSASTVGAGGLALLFRAWRNDYERRRAWGERELIASIEPLGEVAPKGVEPARWREVVDRTKGMLEALVASNLLDPPAVKALGERVRATVAKARPETVVGDLSELWDEVAAKGGPAVVKRHPKPSALP